MITVGLTGQSGAGKGFVCGIWKEMGIPSLDTDAVAHGLYVAGHPCVGELTEAFGDGILREDGTPDRAVLRGIVFADPAALAKLNEITHKYIRQTTLAWIDEKKAEGRDIAVVDAPVLFESGFDALCDCTVGVLAKESTRVRRITERDHIKRKEALARIRAQHDDAYFETHCDFIVRNERKTDPTAQVEAVTEEIRRRYGTP